MRKILALLILTLGLLIPQVAVALASNVTDATYSGTVRISNNSTAATVVSTNLSLNTQNLIDALLCSSNLSNVALQTNGGADTAFMPARNGTSSWCVYVPSIGEDAYLDYKLYTGGNASMNGTTRYFPGTGGMTTEDDATMELGANFTFLQRGFFNTDNASSKYLVNKSGAFMAFVSPNTSGNITAGISGNWTTPDSATLAATWTDEALAIDSDTATFADYIFGSSPVWGAWLEMPHTAILCDSIRVWVTTTGAGTVNTIDVDIYYNGAWSDLYEGSPTKGAWVTLPMSSPQIIENVRLRWYCSDHTLNPHGRLNELDYGKLLSVSASGVTTAEHSVNITANSTNLTISIDGVVADTVALGGASVPNTANNWTFLQNDVMPYMEYQKIWVGGSLKQHIAWEYTTDNFTDLSGNGNDAAPTYRTDSSDADVSAELLDFGPANPPEATSGQTGTSQPIAGNMTNIAGMYTELSINFPLSSVFNTLLDAGGVPRALFWFPLIFLSVIGISFLLNIVIKHLFVKAAIAGFFLALASLMGGFGLWVVFAYIIFAADILIAQKHYSW